MYAKHYQSRIYCNYHIGSVVSTSVKNLEDKTIDYLHNIHLNDSSVISIGSGISLIRITFEDSFNHNRDFAYYVNNDGY